MPKHGADKRANMDHLLQLSWVHVRNNLSARRHTRFVSASQPAGICVNGSFRTQDLACLQNCAEPSLETAEVRERAFCDPFWGGS